MKLLIKLSIASVVMLFIAVALLFMLVNPNDYKTEIETQVKQHLKRDLHIKGDINWAFYPHIGFSSGEIELDNLQGFDKPHLIKINKASVGLNIESLLKGQISLAKLTIDGFELTLLTDKNGLSNLDNMGTTTETNNSEPTEQTEKIDSEDKVALDISKTQLDGIDIKNAIIELQNLQTGSYQKITINEIKLGQFTFDKETLLTINSQIIIDDLQAEIKLSTQLFVDSELHNIKLNKLLLNTHLTADALPNGQLQSTLQANINYALNDQKITIEGLDINTLISADNIPNKKILTQINADIIYQIETQKASINNLKLAVDQLKLDGQLTVQTGDITKVRYTLSTNELDLSPYISKAKISAHAETDTAMQTDVEEIEPDLSFLTTLDIEGDLTIAGIKMDNITIGEIKKHLIIKQGKAQLKPLTVQLYQGSLTINAQVDESNGLNKYQLVSQLKDVQLYPLLTEVAGLEILSGNTNANFSGNGQGLSATKIQQGIIGKGDFSLLDGELYGINLSQEIRSIKAKIKGIDAPTNNDVKKTDFASLSGNFSIKEGLLNNQKLLMTSPAIRLDGAGLVHIIKQSLDYKLSISPLSKTTEKTDYTDLNGITIPLLISGTFDAPHFSLDTNSVLKAQAKMQLAAKKEKLQEKAQQALSKKLGSSALQDKLKSFF